MRHISNNFLRAGLLATALACGTAPIASLAATDPGTVLTAAQTLAPHWKAGDKLAYRLTKTRTKTKDGNLVQRITSTTPMTLDVAEAGPQGYVLNLRYGETTFEDPKMNADPFLRQMTDLAKGQIFVVELSPEGAIRRIRNWQDIQHLMSQTVEKLRVFMRDQGMPAADVDKITGQVASVFTTEAQIRQTGTKELQMLLIPLGRTYRPGAPFEYASQLPNVLGGEPIPAKGSFTMAPQAPAKGQVRLDWQQAVEPEAFQRIMKSALENMAQKLGKPMPPDTNLNAMMVRDQGQFTVDVATGWAASATHIRTSGAESQSQVETTSLVRQ